VAGGEWRTENGHIIIVIVIVVVWRAAERCCDAVQQQYRETARDDRPQPTSRHVSQLANVNKLYPVCKLPINSNGVNGVVPSEARLTMCTWGCSRLEVHSGLTLLVVVRVRLSLPSTSTQCADVVTATEPGSVYDLAVLKIRHFHCRSEWPNRLSIS